MNAAAAAIVVVGVFPESCATCLFLPNLWLCLYPVLFLPFAGPVEHGGLLPHVIS